MFAEGQVNKELPQTEEKSEGMSCVNTSPRGSFPPLCKGSCWTLPDLDRFYSRFLSTHDL